MDVVEAVGCGITGQPKLEICGAHPNNDTYISTTFYVEPNDPCWYVWQIQFGYSDDGYTASSTMYDYLNWTDFLNATSDNFTIAATAAAAAVEEATSNTTNVTNISTNTNAEDMDAWSGGEYVTMMSLPITLISPGTYFIKSYGTVFHWEPTREDIEKYGKIEVPDTLEPVAIVTITEDGKCVEVPMEDAESTSNDIRGRLQSVVAAGIAAWLVFIL